MTAPDPFELALSSARLAAVCDEMGAVLRQSAFSTNIRDRLDFSCAVFDAEGRLAAQAAHIPVHLGSMAYAMRGVVRGIEWQPGDVWVFNDPYLGGTHLPDVTVVAPVFHGEALVGLVADRAHHADIGSDTPGSMPIASSLEQEGMIIPPTRLVAAGTLDAARLASFGSATRNPRQVEGDFAAQIAACHVGAARVAALAADLEQRIGPLLNERALATVLVALNDHAERLALATLKEIPDGRYAFTDLLDDDGLGRRNLAIAVTLTVAGGRIIVDFTGTAAQTGGNVNCPISVAAAGALYCFRCLMPDGMPMCDGTFRAITLVAPEGCLVNAQRPAAVAAGNVETSSRIVDAVFGALAKALPERIPAASQGTMNNLALGSAEPGAEWDYYETIGGGMGASPSADGLSVVQTHMTNTRNTPTEVLELGFPLRVRRYARRAGSGGAGLHRGGDGILRELEFLAPATVTVLAERRARGPWGLAGGADGAAGINRLNGEEQPGKFSWKVESGDVLTIETPGGGGWGRVR